MSARPDLEPAIENEPPVRKTFWARLFDFSDPGRHDGAEELAPPPRSIPLSLALFFFFNARTFLFPLGPLAALAAVAAVVTDLGFEPLGERATRLVAGAVVLGGLALYLASRWRRLGLFAGGLDQRGTLIEKLEGLGGYRDSPVKVWSGWGYQTTSYSGPAYVSIVEIHGHDDKTARLKIRGVEYQGEPILFDPRDPRRHLRASRFGVRAVPDKAGQWQVRGFGRSLALSILAIAALAVAACFGVILVAAGL